MNTGDDAEAVAAVPRTEKETMAGSLPQGTPGRTSAEPAYKDVSENAGPSPLQRDREDAFGIEIGWHHEAENCSRPNTLMDGTRAVFFFLNVIHVSAFNEQKPSNGYRTVIVQSLRQNHWFCHLPLHKGGFWLCGNPGRLPCVKGATR